MKPQVLCLTFFTYQMKLFDDLKETSEGCSADQWTTSTSPISPRANHKMLHILCIKILPLWYGKCTTWANVNVYCWQISGRTWVQSCFVFKNTIICKVTGIHLQIWKKKKKGKRRWISETYPLRLQDICDLLKIGSRGWPFIPSDTCDHLDDLLLVKRKMEYKGT